MLMKSANPLNAPLIRRLLSPTFLRCVCWRQTTAAADSFIVLLFRLHLKSMRTNGRVFDLNVSVLSSPRSPPPANQTATSRDQQEEETQASKEQQRRSRTRDEPRTRTGAS